MVLRYICTEEVDSDMTRKMEVNSTEVGGEIKWLNSLLREESIVAVLLELGRGISSGLASSEVERVKDSAYFVL